VNGTIVRVPGVKEMYDYEKEGYNIPKPPGKTFMINEKEII
jgi:hypothetical protein